MMKFKKKKRQNLNTGRKIMFLLSLQMAELEF